MASFRRIARLTAVGLTLICLGTGAAWAQGVGSGSPEWIDRYGFPVALLLFLGVAMLRVWRFMAPLLDTLARKHFEAVDALTRNSTVTTDAVGRIDEAITRFGVLIEELSRASMEEHAKTQKKLDDLAELLRCKERERQSEKRA